MNANSSFILLRRMLGESKDATEEDWRALAAILRPARLSGGAYFVHEGEVPERLGFIVRGLVRVFYTTEAGEDRIVIFRDEGRPVAPYFAYLAGESSPFSIQALEDSEFLTASLRDIERLTAEHPFWAAAGAAYTRQLFIEKEERERELLSMSATERYARFKERYPGIEKRVKQYHIASYLGITSVALSRIRGTAKM